MSPITKTILTVALGTCATSAANAQSVESSPVEEKHLATGKHSISAEKGYIFVHSFARATGVFIKTPDANDIAEYEAEWRKELEKNQRAYPQRMRLYEKDINEWNSTRRGKRPIRPIEPTEENFSIGEIERRMFVSFGPQYVFSKGEDASGDKYFTYLHEVEPGEYTYYGPIFYQPNGAAMGTCMCMGSFKFSVAAGEITNLGDFLTYGWVSDEAAKLSSTLGFAQSGRVPRPVDYTLPASLEEFRHGPADLRAAGKINNFFGITVERMPPIDGVLAYDRDTPIDLKGLQETEANTTAAATEQDAPSTGATTELTATQ